MARFKSLGVVLPLAFLFAAFFVGSRPNGRDQTTTAKSAAAAKSQKRKIDINQFPIAEFSSPQPTDKKRRDRGKKRDKSDWAVNPDAVSDSTVTVDAVDLSLPTFPVEQAAAVVIGTVTDANAFLSSDKTGVYSSFGVAVDEVLKNPGNLVVGNSIEVEREGGRVKFPSGRVHLYLISEQDMPHVGGRYVFFLSKTDYNSVFEIITGYEIRGDSIYALDELPQTRTREGTPASTFLQELKTKLGNP